MLGFLSVGILTLLLAGIPVAVTLFLLAFGIDQFYSFFPLTKALGQNLWSAADSFLLIAIPLFVLMGEIIVRAGIAEKAYRAMDHWLSWLPGGLLHANITTSALFSATSGSSVATAATVSTVALPQGKKLGYDPKLFCGSIAAGGTLGILIPPSINLIVYGFLTETSIPKLFMAGLVPGLGLAALFMLASLLLCVWKPSLGARVRARAGAPASRACRSCCRCWCCSSSSSAPSIWAGRRPPKPPPSACWPHWASPPSTVR